MVVGLERFKEWFESYKEQYVIIGGTACDLLMSDGGLEFRATKDIDLVLIIEALTPEFGRHFWDFVISAGYEHRNRSTGETQFYRFSHPKSSGYPFMIELFSRKKDSILLPDDAVLMPLPMEEDISSLSAILLDDDYYELLQSGKTEVDEITVLDVGMLILFKAKAWLDLSKRRSDGEHIDSKNIRKHTNDIFRLSALLSQNARIPVNQTVCHDMQEFIAAMRKESLDIKQLGIRRTKEEILDYFTYIYYGR